MPSDTVKLKEIKPVLFGYIREAQFMLDPGEIPGEKVVHDVRVLMKKSRALIKLLKSQVDEESFNKEYGTLKDVGRIMQSWRETSVHRKLVKSLKKKYPRLFSQLTDNEKINLLLGKYEIESGPSPEMKNGLENIIDLLLKSGYRWRFRTMKNLDPNLLLKELEKTYITVAACYMTARNYQKTANLHEFRKRSKDFLYQLYLFRALNPKPVKTLEKQLDSIAQNLGRYNDFAVLINTLGYRFSRTETRSALDELILIIKQEQDKCLTRVWPAAFRIFRPGRTLVNVLGFKVLTI
jgi:CHAD domain-containing protein